MAIDGTNGDDILTGSLFADTINGFDGIDILHGGYSADILNGGAGNDSFRYLFTDEIAAGEVIDGGTGRDKIVISGWPDGIENENEIDFDFRATTLRSIERIEFSYNFDKNAIINSSQLGSGLYVYASIIAVDFNGTRFQPATVNEFHVYVDTASTDLSGLNFYNWMANDSVMVFGTRGADAVNGSEVDDTIYGYLGDDVLDGNRGDDLLFGGRGNDIVKGGWGADTLFGNSGDDVIIGAWGADTLFGNSGHDMLYGEWGNDVIYAGGWSDMAFGGWGDDTIHGNQGNDQLHGGGGDDTIHGNRGNDRLFGESGNDTMIGGHGRDFIYGGWDNDQIHGNGFADELYGEMGDDFIYGGAGSDIINGGFDNDSLWGGDGTADDGVTDRFIFEYRMGNDRIHDFEDGIDKIDFVGNSSFNDFADVSTDAVQIGDDIIITQSAGNTLTIDDMNLADLDASDFIF